MVDDIVREAGVTKKVFYRFFRRKDDFIVECYLVHAGDMLALYRRILGQPGDAQARILAVFSVLERVAASADFTGCGLMRVGAGLGNRRDHPLRLVVSGFKHAVEGLFETILAEKRGIVMPGPMPVSWQSFWMAAWRRCSFTTSPTMRVTARGLRSG